MGARPCPERVTGVGRLLPLQLWRQLGLRRRGPARGLTADAALAALVAQMDQPTTWLAVQEGYVAAPRQTYVMQRGGKPWVSASVTRGADGTYTASLGALCRDVT